MKARDDLAMSEAPKSYYQYERDMKSFKDDAQKQLKYLMNISAENVCSIFKSDLEADPLLHIFRTFSAQGQDFISENSEFIVKFIKALVSVSPFEMCCDFLMDDEKDVIKNLIQKLP